MKNTLQAYIRLHHLKTNEPTIFHILDLRSTLLEERGINGQLMKVIRKTVMYFEIQANDEAIETPDFRLAYINHDSESGKLHNELQNAQELKFTDQSNTEPTDQSEQQGIITDLLEKLKSYVEWHESAIPKDHRDDYEDEYLLAESKALITNAEATLTIKS